MSLVQMSPPVFAMLGALAWQATRTLIKSMVSWCSLEGRSHGQFVFFARVLSSPISLSPSPPTSNSFHASFGSTASSIFSHPNSENVCILAPTSFASRRAAEFSLWWATFPEVHAVVTFLARYIHIYFIISASQEVSSASDILVGQMLSIRDSCPLIQKFTSISIIVACSNV